MPFRPPLSPVDEPTSIKHRGQYKYIDFYINLLNLTNPFDSSLKKWMCKAAHHSDGVDSSNPHRWRGERLHHHGGGVCWLFLLLWMDSWHHELIVCKKWFKNNLKMRLTALFFDPPRHAPHQASCGRNVESEILIVVGSRAYIVAVSGMGPPRCSWSWIVINEGFCS